MLPARALIHVFGEPGTGAFAQRRLAERDDPVTPPFEDAPAFRLADLDIAEPVAF